MNLTCDYCKAKTDHLYGQNTLKYLNQFPFVKIANGAR